MIADTCMQKEKQCGRNGRKDTLCLFRYQCFRVYSFVCQLWIVHFLKKKILWYTGTISKICAVVENIPSWSRHHALCILACKVPPATLWPFSWHGIGGPFETSWLSWSDPRNLSPLWTVLCPSLTQKTCQLSGQCFVLVWHQKHVSFVDSWNLLIVLVWSQKHVSFVENALS